MTDSVPALQARRLCAAYHQQTVLEDITLSLPQGQWTADRKSVV